MKRLNQQPKTMVLAIAIALGIAAVAGCSADYDNTPATSAADTDANMTAGAADSNQPVSDTWITTKVKTSLATMQGVDNSDIHVETNNGVVTITGTAASQDTVNAVNNAAMQVKGVTRVDTSGLTVGTMGDNNANNGMQGAAGNDGEMSAGMGNSEHAVKDTWITTKVKAKLQTVDDLDNTDLHVETNNGVVILSGRADSQAMADAAVKATKSIEGVQKVDTSRLEIGPEASN